MMMMSEFGSLTWAARKDNAAIINVLIEGNATDDLPTKMSKLVFL